MLLTVVIPSLMARDYKLVTSADELESGKYVIITNSGATVGLSTTQNSNNRGQADITKNADGLITVDESKNSDVQQLLLGDSDGKYTFYTGSGYLYAASSKSNHLKTQTTLDDNSKAEITFAKGVPTIKFTGTNTRNLLKYNSSSKIFACYASGQGDVAIYQEYVPAAVADPVITVAERTYFVGDAVNVTLSCEEADVTIHYTTDGTEPTAETPTTGTSVTVTPTKVGSVTIKAIAVKNGKTSNVVTQLVAINPIANSVAEYNSLEIGQIVRINCDLFISFAAGSNIFAQDAEGNAMFLYSKNGIGEAANGKIIPANGLIGVIATYNGNRELNFTDYALPTLNGGDAVLPESIPFTALSDSYLYKYVKISDVTLGQGSDGTKYSVNEVNDFLTNIFSLETWPTDVDGKVFNIYGVYVKASKSDYCVYFADAEEVVIALDAPTLDVTGGTYDVEKTVTITAADGAEVRYTTNDESDIKGGVEGVDYTIGNTVSIDKSCTLRVVAVKDGGFSPVVTETYVMKTAKPEITMGDDKKVSITTDYQNGVTIYYTTDGTTVTAESEVYSEPFTIARGSVVKAVAKYKEFDLSDEVSFNYTQERSVVFDAASTSDFPGIEDKNTLDDTDFTKDGIIVRFEKGTSSSKQNLYYVNDGQIRFYKDNILKISAEGSAIISSVEFKTTTTASYLLKSPKLSSGTYTNDGASGVWKDINAQSATLTNETQQARLLSIKVNYIVPEEAANVLKINEEGAYYVVNFTLEGVKENGGVLYARTIEDSVEPSDPKKDYFDKGYEDYDLNKFTQRDWVAIAGLKSDYAEKQIATGFVARYDGTKLVPVTNVVPGDGVTVELNTFGVANVFYGNYENTADLKMQGGYQPFFVKAKVNEVAYYLGSVKLNDGKYELWGSGVCGNFKDKGLEIEATNGTELAESATYKQIEGVLVKDEAANGGVKLIAMNVTDTPTGVEALKANGKAAIYGTEGAVVVAGADGKVAIFDAMGRMVKSVSAEGAATVEMPAGYYIVRTAGTAKAVIVK